MKSIPVSVCIPVFNSEKFLAFCLESIAAQTFQDFEIIIVNDASTGTDSDGKNCKQLVKEFSRNNRKIKINYIEHSKNEGLVEARRTAVYAARGEFIFTVDSDDFIPADAIETLFSYSQEYDIIQGNTLAGFFPENAVSGTSESFIPNSKNICGVIHHGDIEKPEIIPAFLVKQSFSGVLWGKLIRKECYLDALDKIPQTYCNLGEEFLQSFFITQYAKKYKGVDKLVYYYRQNSGMTAPVRIDNLESWHKLCSVASVYSIIYLWLEDQKEQNGVYPMDKPCLESLQARTRHFVRNNILALNNVISDLRPQAYEILCDYWGESFVKHVEELIDKANSEQKNKENVNEN